MRFFVVVVVVVGVEIKNDTIFIYKIILVIELNFCCFCLFLFGENIGRRDELQATYVHLC